MAEARHFTGNGSLDSESLSLQIAWSKSPALIPTKPREGSTP